MNALTLEGRACAALIGIAEPQEGDYNRPDIGRARILCAQALRAWRTAGERKRAQWFKRHIAFIGYPLKP